MSLIQFTRLNDHSTAKGYQSRVWKALRPKNERFKCGKKFEAGTNFCLECGNNVS